MTEGDGFYYYAPPTSICAVRHGYISAYPTTVCHVMRQGATEYQYYVEVLSTGSSPFMRVNCENEDQAIGTMFFLLINTDRGTDLTVKIKKCV